MTLSATTVTVGTDPTQIAGSPQEGAAIVFRNFGPKTVHFAFGTVAAPDPGAANVGSLITGDAITLPASDYISVYTFAGTAKLCYFVGTNRLP